MPALRDALHEVGRPDIMIVVGGVIPPGDFDALYAAGATAIFPPGTVIADAAIDLLHKLAERRGTHLPRWQPRTPTPSTSWRPPCAAATAPHWPARSRWWSPPGSTTASRLNSCCWR
ncbi:methylmalonyl-CoA mutase C-terminal domain protein [Mycobacterium xenopi 4042]|uniref:Methylmalonyl-CoA mutase C-terminal domain protein n=1 Tax=Mycobacterium xenopi 4042 TaxID=1299334 RepID=X7YQW5_MYCXE|nr:methylmalonyl-CoA mutase C-terminal domain protein [Mycobacterium xenopi 4042]